MAPTSPMLIALFVLFALLAFGFSLWRLTRRTGFFLHILQLDGYKRHEYVAWIVQNWRGLIVRLSHVLAVVVVAAGAQLVAAGYALTGAGLAVVAWPVLFASSRRYRRQTTKKPMVFTQRMRRLGFATAVVSAAVAVVPLVLIAVSNGGEPLPFAVALLAALGGLGLADLLAPLTVWVSALLLEPVESSIQRGFKVKARQRIASRPDLLIVGITGSYGKTSTKAAVAAVLGHRLSVLATPGSYNTPMGLCKVINDMLKPQHQALVLEMGARYRGDIQELCDLVTPSIGIVTNVGVAHLDTMGSRDAIALEKGTLAANVSAGGTVILNADDRAVRAMTDRIAGGVTVLTVGTSASADIRADEISFGPDGTEFVVTDESGDRQNFQTSVLGIHNVMNILFAVAVGRTQDIRLRAMAQAVAAMPAVDHRLKLRKEGDVMILDDAFNSNPVGARNAVDILRQFDSGKRIVITPGMVELGPAQDEENEAFGRYMADKADVVLLVGARQTRPIQDGLLAAGFPESGIHVFRSLAAAREHLRTVIRPGDVVLYENDLPDHYEEAA